MPRNHTESVGGRLILWTKSRMSAVPNDPFLSICDYVGLSQHKGECWVDTIQQIFFFTDGLKELTQPLFYTMTDAKLHEYMHKAVAAGIFSDDIITPKAAPAAPAAPPAAAPPAVAPAAVPVAAPAAPPVPPEPSDPPIIAAVKTNDIATVTRLLESGTSIETVDVRGNTLFILAAEYGYNEIIAFLLKKGANINAVNKWGMTALMYTAIKGYESIARFLLTKGADVDAANTNKTTALMLAALNGYPLIVNALLQKGANVNAETNDGTTPLIYSTMHGNVPTVTLLLNNGAKINVVDNEDKTPLVHAILNNNYPVVKLLLDRGANVNIEKYIKSPLWWAMKKKNEPIARLLLDKGADINTKDDKGNTPLITAIIGKEYNDLSFLLKIGANIDIPNNSGRTPLIEAVFNDNVPIITFLLENGANVNAQTKAGGTALIVAAHGGIESIVRALLKRKDIDLNIKNNNRLTALDVAIKNNNYKIIELLQVRMKSAKNAPFNASAIKPDVEEPVGVKTMLSIYEEGIKAMRDRFKNHYDVIVHNDEAICSIDGPQKTRQMYLASIAGRTLFKRFESKRLGEAVGKGTQSKILQQARLNSGGKYTEENAGGSLVQELVISNLLYRTFNLPFRAIWLVTGLDSNASIHALGIDMMHIEGKTLFGAHATGFLKCKGMWYYYNDNTGLYAVSANLVTALQIAVNINDGEKHDSICIKTVKDRCYLLKLNNVVTIYKYNNYGFNTTQYINGNVTPAAIWIETKWIDYTTWKSSNLSEATEIETTVIMTEKGLPSYYNVLTSAYCVVKYDLSKADKLLYSAIRTNHSELFETIKDDVHYDPFEVLKEALQYKNQDIINTILLKHNDIDPNVIVDAEGSTLFIKLLENNVMIPDKMLETIMTSVDYNPLDLIKKALLYTNNYIIHKILSKHSDINPNTIVDSDGTTLFMILLKNHMSPPDTMLETVDVNLQDKNGMTALMYAAKGIHSIIFKDILKNEKINVNLQDKNGMTALMYATKGISQIILKDILTNEKVDVNLQDKDGMTALMHAAMDYDYSNLEKVLENKKVNLHLKNKKGETALDLAYNEGNKKRIEGAIAAAPAAANNNGAAPPVGGRRRTRTGKRRARKQTRRK